MINIIKLDGYFNPINITDDVHVIGLGAIGSHIATGLVRMGLRKLHLWDIDTVEDKNRSNQEYTSRSIDQTKVEAMTTILKEIVPDIEIIAHPDGYKNEELGGYVFMCVDSMGVRNTIVDNVHTATLKAIFDFRLRLTDAQHYAAKNDFKQLVKLKDSMNFTDEEADRDTPVSACGETLNVITTVRVITSLGLTNFINIVNNRPAMVDIQYSSETWSIDTIDENGTTN